ncbi:hypothetical protein OV208_34725 [Corallococcus sp. bb12-1]|uniref:hypothetical protein n=1 Tax=Corallococcus sp. bb12-1 TaxID=2996784 RepID=UPI00226DE51F|nr:hypothetical protein [Corallococcus sp. bb12-1]MCY1046512.1 hypothetical protein [Corallococcus sp. bb12-1]
MPKLMSLRTDAASALGESLEAFQPSADRSTLLMEGESIVLSLHLIATATLLVDGNAQGFFLNLCRMAENWRRLILLLRSRELVPPSVRRTAPLLAALAAGHFQLADALAVTAATPHQQDDYEDEYLWACILQAFARQAPPVTGMLEPLLDRLEAVGTEEYAPLCGIARALLARDASRFARNFEAARLEYQSFAEKRARAFDTAVTGFAPHRFLWLEGLALLRLSERAGIAPEDTDFQFCPPLARLPMTVLYLNDWVIPGTALG